MGVCSLMLWGSEGSWLRTRTSGAGAARERPDKSEHSVSCRILAGHALAARAVQILARMMWSLHIAENSKRPPQEKNLKDPLTRTALTIFPGPTSLPSRALSPWRRREQNVNAHRFFPMFSPDVLVPVSVFDKFLWGMRIGPALAKGQITSKSNGFRRQRDRGRCPSRSNLHRRVHIPFTFPFAQRST